MRVLLDTTYLTPAIGVQIRGVPPDALSQIRGAGHALAVRELTLLELSAKGARLAASGRLSPERVHRGVLAVARDDGLTRIPLLDEDVFGTSLRLRGMLVDYLDCVMRARPWYFHASR